MFPSDHVVKNVARFAEVIRAGVELAASGEKIVVLGVPPTRAETGYGYIELGAVVDLRLCRWTVLPVRRVKRFTEKPDRARAEEFVASGNYAWNGGIFLWSARTLADAIREHCPAMAPLLEKIAAAYGTAEFERVFAEVYPQCENISDRLCGAGAAVGEGRDGRRRSIACRRTLGGTIWARGHALHEHSRGWSPEEVALTNVFDGVMSHHVVIDASGNYVYAPGKAVALVGVSDLVVVETEDALLITTRERSQDVGKVVAELKSAGREDLI